MPTALVAGCGFVGRAVAHRLAEAGWNVTGLTHSAVSADALRGATFSAVACDIADRSSVRALGRIASWNAVVHCASSGRGGAEEYRRVYLEGARNLAEELEPGIFVFASSTSVYAQTGGEWVTEESSAEPQRETGRILRESEELVLVRGGTVARLAGIYGPGRSVLLQKFFDRTAVIEDGGKRWINQVHRDDAASALTQLVERATRGIFNVSDDTPIQQRALYEWLAARFDAPCPPDGAADSNRKRGVTNKRVSNAKLRTLGWQPRFASFFEAIGGDPEIARLARHPA